MLKRASAILWRKCNKATFDTLDSASDGQYDIRLAIRDYENFFLGVDKVDPTARGGHSLKVVLEPFTGPSPVALTSIKVTYLGKTSGRKDWIISSQRRGNAYPLWRQGRGVGKKFEADANEFVVIIRDVDGKFHARWIHHADFNALPDNIKTMLSESEVGWGELH